MDVTRYVSSKPQHSRNKAFDDKVVSGDGPQNSATMVPTTNLGNWIVNISLIVMVTIITGVGISGQLPGAVLLKIRIYVAGSTFTTLPESLIFLRQRCGQDGH